MSHFETGGLFADTQYMGQRGGFQSILGSEILTVVKTLVILMLCVSASGSNVKTQSELRKYHKCHLQLLQYRPSSSDQMTQEVQAGLRTGAEACSQLIERSKLNATSGRLETIDNQTSAFLANVQKLHNTFFANLRFEHSLTEEQIDDTAYEIYDYNAPGYYLTRVLLDSSYLLSDIFLDPKSYKAIRVDPNTQQAVIDAKTPRMRRLKNEFYKRAPANDAETNDVNKLVPFTNLPYVPVGRLIGITSQAAFRVASVSTKYLAGDAEPVSSTVLRQNVNMHENYGGGVIGSSNYLMLNLGRNTSFKANGGIGIARMWSKNVLKDFLCKDLPAVRIEDAATFTDVNSPLPFRTRQSCAQCHATMDPLSGGIRNLRLVTTHRVFNNHNALPLFTRYPASLASEAEWPKRDDAQFHLRPPIGKLMYRNSEGLLIQANYNGLNQLGERLLNQDDFYRCVASKYFSYFTQIQIDLNDPVSRKSEDSQTASAREFLYKISSELKSEQSLKNLLVKIWSSEFY